MRMTITIDTEELSPAMAIRLLTLIESVLPVSTKIEAYDSDTGKEIINEKENW
jgi:hypothetical protein